MYHVAINQDKYSRMTVKELFAKLIEGEKGAFVRVIEALPADKLDYKPHPNSKSAGEIMNILPWSPKGILSILKDGGMTMTGGPSPAPMSPAEASKAFSEGVAELVAYVRSMPEEDLEKEASIGGGGSTWTTTRAEMAFGFLMDAIHHRGQLSTYLRPMGGKVPSIYGPSGDSGPVMA
jgi:uncharacterized damage-inducible protein DinB